MSESEAASDLRGKPPDPGVIGTWGPEEKRRWSGGGAGGGDGPGRQQQQR